MDFLGFSYGFRSGKSQHGALDALSVGICRKKVNWILDADIEGFFDMIDHNWMIVLLERRIGDRRVLRLIRNWLEAGISEDGQVTKASVGTPQGAVISPLLNMLGRHRSQLPKVPPRKSSLECNAFGDWLTGTRRPPSSFSRTSLRWKNRRK